MTGIAGSNLDAFNQMAALLRMRHSSSWEIVNPAEHFDGDLSFPRWTYMRADLRELSWCDAIALMPGWEQSAGAKLEVENALEMGLDLYLALPDGTLQSASITRDYRAQVLIHEVPAPIPQDGSVALEGHRLVHGDRNEDYGHPLDDMDRTGRIIGAILGIPDVAAEKVCLIMEAVKISRAVNGLDHGFYKRDNPVDGVGYWECFDWVAQERQLRKEQAA